MYKLSQYTVVHNLAERGLPDYNLVFNTLAASSFLVRATDWNNLLAQRFRNGETSGETGDAVKTLLKKGIINSTDTDDRALYEKTFNHQRYHPQKIYPLIAVTSACNIGCTYCYESGIKGKTMSVQVRSEEHTSELQSRQYLVCRLLLEKKNINKDNIMIQHH